MAFTMSQSAKTKVRISPRTGKPFLKRGFAAMDPEKRRAIAIKGGGSVPPEKRSFAKDKTLAASAGKKGGEASRGGGRMKAQAQAKREAADAQKWDGN
jgi:general stress protein YciG